MKHTLLAVLLALAAGTASAANYNLSATWSDATPQNNYTPTYDAEVRVAGGAATPIPGTAAKTLATTVVATPGDKIELRVRATNTIGPIVGPWSIWYAATAPVVPTTPLVPTGVVITITVQ
jgi:hypothetical protein